MGNNSKERIHVFTRSDACGAADAWAKYLGKKQEDLKGTGVFGDPGVAEAVTKNKFALGYNNIAFTYDATTRRQNKEITVAAIDVNGNGSLEAEENFYATLDSIDKAILDGKYPSPPARDLYFVSKGSPANALLIAFLKWTLSEGQKFVGEAGYVKLPDDVLSKELEKLNVK